MRARGSSSDSILRIVENGFEKGAGLSSWALPKDIRPHQHYEKYQITTSRRLDGDSACYGNDGPVLHGDFESAVLDGNGLVRTGRTLPGDG